MGRHPFSHGSLHQYISETMAQALLLINPSGAILTQAGAPLQESHRLGVLLAQIVAAFQHIAGRGMIYQRSIFFSYQDHAGRYALVSQENQPFLAAVYQSKIQSPPPLGLTRFLLRRAYQHLLTVAGEHPESALAATERASLPASEGNALFQTDFPTVGEGRALATQEHQELQQALQKALTEIRASLILAADDSGAVVSVSGASEHNPAMIGALAVASLSAFREVEKLGLRRMQNAYALLEGSRNAVVILKEDAQPLVFVAVVPQRPGRSLGMARIVLGNLAKRQWHIERTTSLRHLGLDTGALPQTGELSLLDWGEDSEPQTKDPQA